MVASCSMRTRVIRVRRRRTLFDDPEIRRRRGTVRERGVHVRLNLRLRQRAVVDARFVDGAREEPVACASSLAPDAQRAEAAAEWIAVHDVAHDGVEIAVD